MSRLVALPFLMILGLSADLIDDYKRNSKVIVIHGEKAPEAERQAARKIYETLELGQIDGLYDHIITDTYALKHQFFYASFHLIIVGTPRTNIFFSTNAEVQVASPETNDSKTKIFPDLNMNQKALFGARFGYYPQATGIGYVRRMLSPLTLQAFNLSEGRLAARPYTATYVGGTDADGVTEACSQFLDHKMLEGAVIPVEYLAGHNSRFRLAKANLNKDILTKVNTQLQVQLGSDSLQYKGWIQGAVGDYGGVKELCGVAARQIVHLKYAGMTPQLMTYDDQVNTVMLINFEDEASSLAALRGIDKRLQLSLQISEEPTYTVYSCGDWFLMRQGSALFIENFSPKWQGPFFRQTQGPLKPKVVE